MYSFSCKCMISFFLSLYPDVELLGHMVYSYIWLSEESPKWLCHPILSSAVSEASSFLQILHRTYFLLWWMRGSILATLIGVKWNFIVLRLYISLMTSNVKFNLFSCVWRKVCSKPLSLYSSLAFYRIIRFLYLLES